MEAGKLVAEHGGVPWVSEVGREVGQGGGASGDGLLERHRRRRCGVEFTNMYYSRDDREKVRQTSCNSDQRVCGSDQTRGSCRLFYIHLFYVHLFCKK